MIDINPATLLITGAVISISSAVATSCFNLWIQRQQRKLEEKKHRREIVVKAATDNWRQVADLLLKNDGVVVMPPLQNYIIHMAAISDVVFDDTTTSENIIERLKKVDDLCVKVHENTRTTLPTVMRR